MTTPTSQQLTDDKIMDDCRASQEHRDFVQYVDSYYGRKDLFKFVVAELEGLDTSNILQMMSEWTPKAHEVLHQEFFGDN